MHTCMYLCVCILVHAKIIGSQVLPSQLPQVAAEILTSLFVQVFDIVHVNFCVPKCYLNNNLEIFILFFSCIM